MKSKLFAMLLTVVVVAGLAGPIAAQDDVLYPCAGGEDVTINFMNWWGASREDLMNDVIANFNEVCPNITVVNAVQAWDNRAEVVATAAASSNPPNLIMTTRVETYQFASQGLIEPITDYVAASGIDPEAIFYPGEIGNQYFDGVLYTRPLPTAGGISGLMLVNKTMLREAGLDLDNPPMTWQEVEAASEVITETDPFGLVKLGAHILENDATELDLAFAYWLYTNNGQLVSDDGRTVMFNSAEGVETLEWMVSFVNEYSGGVEAVREFMAGRPDLTTADAPIYIEELAMAFPNVSGFGHIQNTDPEMWEDTETWSMVLRPYNGTNPEATYAGVSGLAFSWGYVIPVNQSDLEKAAAYAFLKFLTTAEDGACYFMFAQGRPSPVRACNDNPAYY